MTKKDDKKKAGKPESKDLEISQEALLNAPFTDLDLYSFEKMLEEVNVLDLEGYIFAFDARNKGYLLGKHTYDLGNGKSLVLKFDEDYGQPASLAYKVLQAVFKKITDEGQPFSEVANFTGRELNLLCGRSSWGGNSGNQLYEAIHSLHRTHIQAHLLDKETGEYCEANFYLFPKVLLSGKIIGESNQIHTCSIRLEQAIVDSLNKDYWVAFNWDVLKTLQPISMALYKRLYRHFSWVYSQRLRQISERGGLSERELIRARRDVKFQKSYGNVIDEWFGGGVKKWRYKSDVKKSIGPHLDALKKTKLLRSWSIEKMVTGELKLVFRPGADFFKDYEKLWLGQFQPQFRFQQSKALKEIQEPLQLVDRFYQKLTGVGVELAPVSQQNFARDLIETYGYAESVDLVDFAVEKAKETNFDIQTIQGISGAIPAWKVSIEHRERSKKRQQKAEAEAKQAKLESAYERFLNERVQDFRDSLSPDKLGRFKKKAEQEFNQIHPDSVEKMRPMGIRIVLNRLFLEATNPPSFNEWISSKSLK